MRALFLEKNHCSAALVGIAAALGVGLTIQPASAQTVFFQTGFEASEGYSSTVSGPITIVDGTGNSATFNQAPGALIGQPSGNPYLYRFFENSINPLDYATAVQRAVNGTTVVNTSAASGSQSVQMEGSVIGDEYARYFPSQSYIAGTNALFSVGADLKVTNPSVANYGQWGVNVLNTGPDGFLQSLAAIGFVGGNVLASSDGNTIYAAISLTNFQPVTAAYGQFNNYSLTMDYGAQTIYGFFNNQQVGFIRLDASGTPVGSVVAGIPFLPTTGNNIGYVAFGQALARGSSETANFDNFRISGVNVTAAAPEPGTLALLGMGLLSTTGLALRRRRSLVR